MAITVGIFGESGDGKTTSIVVDKDGMYDPNNYGGIDPVSTVIINADSKRLPFSPMLDGKKVWDGNVINCSVFRDPNDKNDFGTIEKILHVVNAKPHIKRVIIDTINAVMIDKEMNGRKTAGWDKWLDLAGDIYDMISMCNRFRDDLIIYLFGHVGMYTNVDGEESKCLVTNGRKLEKIKLETKLPVVLFTKVKNRAKGKNEYMFETKKNRSTAKTPMGMFADFEINNSLRLVDDTIRQYYGIE